jgi:hypothetical protein
MDGGAPALRASPSSRSSSIRGIGQRALERDVRQGAVAAL